MTDALAHLATQYGDAIDAALAAEEHRQGRPYLADLEHCARCAEVDRAWAQAVCPHESWVAIGSISEPKMTKWCSNCGQTREFEHEYVPPPPPLVVDPDLEEHYR